MVGNTIPPQTSWPSHFVRGRWDWVISFNGLPSYLHAHDPLRHSIYGRRFPAYLHHSINIANQHQQYPLSSFMCKQGFDHRTIPLAQHSLDNFKEDSPCEYSEQLFQLSDIVCCSPPSISPLLMDQYASRLKIKVADHGNRCPQFDIYCSWARQKP